MIVKIKKFVAKVSIFNEHDDGSISKEGQEITLNGKRFKPSSVWKLIPREYKLLESGWKETAYEIDSDKLEQFLVENGKPVMAKNAE